MNNIGIVHTMKNKFIVSSVRRAHNRHLTVNASLDREPLQTKTAKELHKPTESKEDYVENKSHIEGNLDREKRA